MAPYGCPFKTTHWPAGCLTTSIALNVLVAPFPIPRQNYLSCLLPLSVFFTTLIWIRIKPLHCLPLWHASSGPNPYLLLLGEMPPQQYIFPQRSLSGNPKIDPLFLLTARPHPLNTLTCDPPPMYWLGTSRWCLGPLCMLHSV